MRLGDLVVEHTVVLMEIEVWGCELHGWLVMCGWWVVVLWWLVI